MKRFFILSILFVAVAFTQTSCGLGDAADKAEKNADKFHTYLKNKDTDGMMSMVHPEALANEEEAWLELMEKMSNELNVKKIEKSMGFNSSIQNGTATVTLNYVIHDENHGEVTEKIVLQDSDDGEMKIMGLHYNQ
ncbi:MAG: hypothetical protein Crog4KO_17920 [Crocinitomicaceae bacterium]